MESKKTLIIQGGGFRTGYSTGVLDAFQSRNYNDFDFYLGVSGGAIALSYYLSGQYKKCFDAMCLLAEDKNFISYSGLMTKTGMMNIDYFNQVAGDIIPFDIKKAIENIEGKEMAIVMTERATGEAHYYHPNKKTWLDAVIASCTLPFVTKGKHKLHGVDYFDGGWGDPLPAKWAYEHGSRDITVIRTAPKDMKFTQTWPDFFASIYNRFDPKLRTLFDENHKRYNEAVDFLNNPPSDLKLSQIAPDSPLKAGTYSNSVQAITSDYRYGLQSGIDFLLSK